MVHVRSQKEQGRRRYLIQPSYAMRYIDPYMPVFDGIREAARFLIVMARRPNEVQSVVKYGSEGSRWTSV